MSAGPFVLARRKRVIGTALVLLMAGACKGSPVAPEPNPFEPPPGMASCGPAPPFTTSPLPLGEILELTPLGLIAPPVKTFPTSHMYIMLQRNPGFAPSDPASQRTATLRAPGRIVITGVEYNRFPEGTGAADDYSIRFFPCSDLNMLFMHVRTLSPALAAQVGSFDGVPCRVSPDGGAQCMKAVNFAMDAGDEIGTVVGVLDFGGTDRRTSLPFVNPLRSAGEWGYNQTICPVDYFTAPVRDALRPLFGGNGITRTIEPRCGEVMQDVAGTAKGRWYLPGSPQTERGLGLVHYNIDPARPIFSVGTGVPSIPTHTYWFTPASSGRVNRAFSDVADDAIYCYETVSGWGSPHLIFLQLITPLRLRIGGSEASTCGPPEAWSFPAGSAEFER